MSHSVKSSRNTASFLQPFNLAKVMHSLATTAGRWHQINRSRRALMRLSPYLLDDIGIDRQTCEDEARQPFWKV